MKIMKKNLLFLFTFLLLLTTVFGTKDMPYYPGNSNSYVTTADQYYSVFFDEEGEAFVAVTIDIRNVDEIPISIVNVEIPGRYMQLLNVLQQVRTENCLDWDIQCQEYGQGQTCVQYDYNGNCERYEKPCLKSTKVCTQYEPRGYNVEYKKVNVVPTQLSNSYNLPIVLLTPVKQNEQTNLILIYKVEGYSTSFLGAHTFNFETAKLPMMANSVRVSVNVQQDLILKGGKSNVNYLSGTYAKMSAGMDMMESRQIVDVSNSIRYESGLVKTASYLDPHESFTVKGTYSRSWLRLYFVNIIITILIIFVALFLIVKGFQKLFSSLKKITVNKQADKTNFFVPFMMGFSSVFGLTIFWVLNTILMNLVSSAMRYSSGQLFVVLLMLLGVLITLAVLIGVPIFTGSKYGMVTGFLTMLSMFGWIFLFIIGFIFIIYLLNHSYVYY